MTIIHPSTHLDPWFLVVIYVILLILAFEVWMFIDLISNDNVDENKKLYWVIGMLILHPFVAIAYYFTDHKTHQ
jgi:hypothetical protein